MTNFEQLKQKYHTSHTNPVDSSIIPFLLNQHDELLEEYEINDPEYLTHIIKVTAEKLEGTFGCSIYHIPTNRIFLIRCSSTIFADKKCNFSSVRFENSELLEEGWVYEVVEGKEIVKRIPFKYNSPFFTL